MMNEDERPTLDDILNEFHEAYDVPTAEALELWAKRYPEYRNQLVDFAASWAEQLVLPPAQELNLEEEKLLVDRAMSHVQNVTFQRNDAAASVTEENDINSLIGEAKRVGMSGQEFAKACELDVSLMSKLNNLQIKPSSVPARLVSLIAHVLNRRDESVCRYLNKPPLPLAGKAFLSRGKPQSTGQQSFVDAVLASSLSETEKGGWLDESERSDEG